MGAAELLRQSSVQVTLRRYYLSGNIIFWRGHIIKRGGK